MGLSRASYYKKPAGLREKDQIVIDALNQVVGKNGRWGFGLCFAYLRNEGAPWNHKRVWRIYKEMGLNLPRRTRKRPPKAIRLDNGSELRSAVFMGWCESKGIELKFIQPGKPQQNAFIERFNRTYRHEVLSAHIFENLNQVKEITDQWIRIYNEDRPHSALGKL
jgi:transposase InsO family protein